MTESNSPVPSTVTGATDSSTGSTHVHSTEHGPANGAQSNASQEHATLFSKAYSEARRREQRDLLDHLRQLGMDIIDNDPYKTLSTAFGKRTNESQMVHDRESVWQEQILRERERADRALSDLKTYKIKQELERVASKLNVVDQKDVAALFHTKHSIDHSNEGIRVYAPNGQLVLDERTAEPASLEYAMRKFLDDKPHLVRATSRNGVSASNLIGSPKDLVERYKHGTPEEKRQVLEQLKANPNL